eukprot:gene11615-34323_t
MLSSKGTFSSRQGSASCASTSACRPPPLVRRAYNESEADGYSSQDWGDSGPSGSDDYDQSRKPKAGRRQQASPSDGPFTSLRAFQRTAPPEDAPGMGGTRNARGSRYRILPKMSRGPEPLFMILKLASNPDEAVCALDALQMCSKCNAPDILAEGLRRSNDLGLTLSYYRVHAALVLWGASLEFDNIDRVLNAMPSAGVPPNTKTAYVVIRAAVNGGYKAPTAANSPVRELAGELANGQTLAQAGSSGLRSSDRII